MTAAIGRLRAMSYQDRVANGCIGPDRADLVLAGCAVLEAIRRLFPAERVRIADRGLREGILMQLMGADGVWQMQRCLPKCRDEQHKNRAAAAARAAARSRCG